MNNPKEKLPIVSNNMNPVSLKPQTTNPVVGDENKEDSTSKELGNEVRNAVRAFEQTLANPNNLQ